MRQILRGRCRAVRSHSPLQSNSSNCLVLIPYRHLGNYLLSAVKIYGPTAQHVHKTFYRSMLETYKQVDYSPKPRTVYCVKSWCQPIDQSSKIMYGWGSYSGPVSCLQVGHQGNTIQKSHRHCSTSEVLRDICAFEYLKLSLPEEKSF